MPSTPLQVLGELVDAGPHLAPHEIPAAVAARAAGLGVAGADLHLVDYGQRTLRSVTHDGAELAVDGTLAGRAFATGQVVVAEGDGDPRLWVPLVDGSERLGVLELALDPAGAPAADEATAQRLARLVGDLVVAKRQYTDLFEVRRRRRPLTLAAEIQWDLLPPLTYVHAEVGVAGILEPAYEIGGDSFDYAHDGDRLHFALIDAMGRGMEAVTLATTATWALRHARRSGLDLAGTYRATASLIEERVGDLRFVTAAVGHLEAPTGVLRWINAGHPPPLLVRGRRVVGELRCPPSLPLGLGGEPGPVAEEALEPGDRVVFYTDGMTESHEPGGEQFGVERLSAALEKATHDEVGPAETMRRLVVAVTAHLGGRLHDDATVLMLAWRPEPGTW